MLSIVGIVEVAVCDYLAGVGGMDEATLARIDPHVVDTTLRAAEEHQIAKLQLVAFDALGGSTLVRRRSRHLEAKLVVAIKNQAAAVEAASRGFAPEAI